MELKDIINHYRRICGTVDNFQLCVKVIILCYVINDTNDKLNQLPFGRLLLLIKIAV